LRWYSIKPVCEGDFAAISGWLSENVVLTKLNKVKRKKNAYGNKIRYTIKT
jgi:hypothetical protein